MGYFPHVNGILKNADIWTESWVEDLSTSGYDCVNIGKMHTVQLMRGTVVPNVEGLSFRKIA
jgi:hypothetical protein